ncbi:MAG: hypothetical protein VX901_14750, partial [Candidatus Poribacteria bacterium]|nr:hypothetical protein [Candidatus Poribacteria bacterium]
QLLSNINGSLFSTGSSDIKVLLLIGFVYFLPVYVIGDFPSKKIFSMDLDFVRLEKWCIM